jgi:hypothetical protein
VPAYLYLTAHQCLPAQKIAKSWRCLPVPALKEQLLVVEGIVINVMVAWCIGRATIYLSLPKMNSDVSEYRSNNASGTQYSRYRGRSTINIEHM